MFNIRKDTIVGSIDRLLKRNEYDSTVQDGIILLRYHGANFLIENSRSFSARHRITISYFYNVDQDKTSFSDVCLIANHINEKHPDTKTFCGEDGVRSSLSCDVDDASAFVDALPDMVGALALAVDLFWHILESANSPADGPSDDESSASARECHVANEQRHAPSAQSPHRVGFCVPSSSSR